jgi:hypothetical protein
MLTYCTLETISCCSTVLSRNSFATPSARVAESHPGDDNAMTFSLVGTTATEHLTTREIILWTWVDVIPGPPTENRPCAVSGPLTGGTRAPFPRAKFVVYQLVTGHHMHVSVPLQ